MELGAFNAFYTQIEAIANTLLQDPDNPYAHVYLGSYFDPALRSAHGRFISLWMVGKCHFAVDSEK